jgi:hypothetical protein
MKHLKLFDKFIITESVEEKLVIQMDRDQYNYWRDNRYVGVPDEEAKWAMIDSIKLFEKHFGHQSKKLTGKYNDEFMTRAYIEGTQHKKLQWEYWRRQSMSDNISAFAFNMFEAEDDYYIINLFANYQHYFYKVDDIIGIENFYNEIMKEQEDYFW